MTYLRRRSPLHAARAVAGAVWCLALVTVALAHPHPVLLPVLLAAVVAAAACAQVARPVLIGVLWSIPFGVTIVLMNALTSREGLTVIWRFWGSWDVTLEAVVQGGVHALVAVVLFAVARLYSAAVDPDDLLRAFRRVSFSSALTAALATRMVPVLARDARRLQDAQRARGVDAGKLVLARAVAAGTMDRALDVAATLEVRGYGHGGRVPALRRAWSRHDIAFCASAAALFVIAVFGSAPFDAYPRVELGFDLLTCVAVVVAVLAPFADRRGI